MSGGWQPLDVVQLSGLAETALSSAFSQIESIYSSVDMVLGAVSRGLDLPCMRGCSACCRQSVFLTPIEFLYGWDWAQKHLSHDALDDIVSRGLSLYQQHQELIEALEEASHQQRDAFSVARLLRFDCPYLGEDGACRIYPARELLGRLFGASLLEDGALYACSMIEEHLRDIPIAFPRAPQLARALQDLPLTSRRQVYPYYIHHLYHPDASSGSMPWW
ncbi:MAG: hypothetical protein H6728_10395 [Myxococcales bacterium]|nr:hypothetical protein [Myxococcales bacterium]MCB9643467.1 hypothetical protein [Myxococcales bacterium]